MIANIG